MLIHTEAQGLIRDSVDRLVAHSLPEAHQRNRQHYENGYSPRLWEQLCRSGFSALLVPEALGGQELGYAEAAIVASLLERRLVLTPFLGTAVLAVSAIREGSEDLQRRHLPEIAAGRTTCALAVDEGPKHAPRHPQTRSTGRGSGFHVEGRKLALLGPADTDYFLVSATDDAGTMTLFIVPAGEPGVHATHRTCIDGGVCSTLELDVILQADALVGTPGRGWPILERVLQTASITIAACLTEIAEECLQQTVEYLKTRVQFGRLIGEYQALQHRAAQMYGDIEITRSLTLKALQALDARDPDVARYASAGKMRADRTAVRCVGEAIQMHGGIGMTEDLDFGLYLRRVKGLREMFGDFGFHAGALQRLSAPAEHPDEPSEHQ